MYIKPNAHPKKLQPMVLKSHTMTYTHKPSLHLLPREGLCVGVIATDRINGGACYYDSATAWQR